MKELPKDQENLAESFRLYLRKKICLEIPEMHMGGLSDSFCPSTPFQLNLFSENTGVF